MKMLKFQDVLIKFNNWRVKKITNKQFLYFLSILIGISAGFAAVIIKRAVHFIKNLLKEISKDKKN